MTAGPRKHATPMGPIFDPATGAVVGWLYLWDNGETSRLMAEDLPRSLKGRPDPAKETPSREE